MTEENGTEPKKPDWVMTSEEEEPTKLVVPPMLASGPSAWIDGARFVLRRKSDNKWKLERDMEAEVSASELRG